MFCYTESENLLVQPTKMTPERESFWEMLNEVQFGGPNAALACKLDCSSALFSGCRELSTSSPIRPRKLFILGGTFLHLYCTFL